MRYFIILTLFFQFLFISKAYTSYLYTCQTDEFCLDELHNDFLNTSSNKSIDKYCKVSLENAGVCCSDPLACSNNSFRQATQTIIERNWSFVTNKQVAPISCQTHQLSVVSNSVGRELCHLAEALCQKECQVKLNEFKEAFKSCFRIPSSSSLDDILEKAKKPTKNQECYKEMRQVAEKYKVQSLEGKAGLKEQIKAEDIVKCKEVNKEKTQENLMKLTQNTCQIAKTKQEQIREKERKKKAREQATAETERKKAREEARKSKAETERKKAREEARKSKAEAERLKAQEKARKTEAEILKSQSQSNEANLETNTIKNQVLNTQTLGQEAQNKLRTESTSKKSAFQSQQDPETIHLARASNNNSGCPISMPEIEYVTMFQSVEAPQKEYIKNQKKIPYNKFDIVTGKPAGLLVKLQKENMDSREKFNMVWKIRGGEKEFKYCFHQPFKEHGMQLIESDKCVFTRDSLEQQGDYKLFPIKEFAHNKKELPKFYKLQVLLYSDKYKQECHKTKTFSLNAFDLETMKIGFTRIEAPKSGGCKYASSGEFKKSSFSKEIDQINRMFPMKVTVSPVIQKIEGSCNNQSSERWSGVEGLLSDIASLDNIRVHPYQDSSDSYDKIVAVVSESYFLYHRSITDVVGFVFMPIIARKSFSFWDLIPTYIGGSWNVLFIREDHQKHTGVLSHELAHTLGQGREFYEDKKACRQFRAHSLQDCRYYMIPRALDVFLENGKYKWSLIKERFSFMSNIVGGSMNHLWIDRDSYQKILSTAIRHKSFVMDPWVHLYDEVEQSINNKQTRDSLKAVISGFYYEKKDRFILAKTDILKNKMKEFSLSENVDVPTLTFQLKEGKTVLQQIKRPVFDLEMEVLYKNKASEKKPFPFFHTRVAFKLPRDYKQRNLSILVLNPKKKLIYSTIVPKKEKSLDSEGLFF